MHYKETQCVTPRVLVVTSCTGEKRFKPKNQLRLEDFKDRFWLQSREIELAEFACSAGQMYTGQQHIRAMEGVTLLRQSQGMEAVDVLILSAGYGLIPEDKTIVPYEVTFNTMKGYEVDEWAKFLGVKQAFEQALLGYDLIFMLLGDNYLRSLRLPVVTQSNQTLIFLASKASANYITGLTAKTFVLPLDNAEAKRYCYGLVGLKGFLLKRFAIDALSEPDLLQRVTHEPEVFRQVIDCLSVQLELPIGQQGGLVRVGGSGGYKELTQNCPAVNTDLATPTNNPNTRLDNFEQDCAREEASPPSTKKDKFLPIPDLPPAPNLHLGMQYFIPEWDDRVDPGYDFLNDVLTPGRDPYEDEIYAHELFPTPNYDGILVSRVVIDKRKTKKALITDVGIHKFIRFTGLVMGDCGAFGYIKEEVPPYTTEEILQYYQHLGFDYGVSIDHLIVGPFAASGIREKRYKLTLDNAEEFIQKHRAGGYTFKPIGVAQGWSPKSYAEAVKTIINMGYDYVALGGLARTPSTNILEILQAIYPYLTPNTRMHLFGVGRINAVPAFRHLGVTSFDSASPLRSAWLDSAANYHTYTGIKYTAVRIPQVDKSGLRVKRLLEAGVSKKETLKRLEENSLHALREFNAGRLPIDETLSVLLTYDELLELPRDGKVNPSLAAKRQSKHRQMYRKLLEDQPWKRCDCAICRKIGVEVVIFRGNDRNRRRGLHNTYVFYKRFKALLKGENTSECFFQP